MSLGAAIAQAVNTKLSPRPSILVLPTSLLLRIEPSIKSHNVDKFRRLSDPLLEIHATAGPDLVSYDERGHLLRHGAIGPIDC